MKGGYLKYNFQAPQVHLLYTILSQLLPTSTGNEKGNFSITCNTAVMNNPTTRVGWVIVTERLISIEHQLK